MFVNKNLWRKYFQIFIVLLAMIISLLPISILETRVKAKTDDYTPDKVLTDEMVGNMAGCEAEIKGNEIIIRPKKGAKEGVISYSYKKDDFKALQYIFKKDETENKTLRFEGNIYGYGSLKELFKDAKISSLGNINKFNVSNVTDMNHMFEDCTNLTSLEALKNWNVSNVTNMSGMFWVCSNLTSIEALKNWNVSNVTNMSGMFSNCNKITSLEALKDWNVSNVTDMNYMFYWCTNLTSIEALKNWNVSNVTDMGCMFEKCTNLTSLEALKNWNVSKVKDMGSMFRKCTNLTSLEALKNWDVSNVTNTVWMFLECTNLTSIEALKNWNVSNVTDMNYMFRECTNLTSIEALKNWNVSKVTDMKYMFYECKNITSLEALKNWNVSKVTDMKYMFYECKNITSLEALKNWNVSKVTDMKYMFEDCTNITSLEALKNWDVSNVTDMNNMFYRCDNLGKYNEIMDTLNTWNMSKVNNTENMFASIGEFLTLDKHKLILDFSNASIKKLSDDTFRKMYGILILNNKNLEYNDSLLENTFLTVTNNENYLNKDKDLKYYRDITLKYGDNKVKKISMPAVYDSKGSKDVYNIIKAEVDKKIKATINELKAEDPSLFLTGEYKNLSTLQEKTLALFGEYELKSQKKESETKVIKAKTKYEADETLPFNEKKVIKVAEDGQKKITITKTLKDGNWVQEGEPKEEIIKPVQDGLTKVGNKEVSTNGDETITKIYEVNPDTGALTNPKVVKKVVVRLETISAKMKYEADENLEYNTKQKVSDPENGQKRITIISTLTNDQLVEGKPTEEIVKPAKDGLTKVGNKKVVKNGDTTTIEKHEVDPNTGDLGKVISKEEIKLVTIKANMKYEADDNLTFNEKKVIKVAEDGQKEVTTKKTLKDGNWVQEGEPKEKVIKPAKDGLTKVGNKEVSTNGDETITKIYEVNPDTGALTNPRTHISRPIGSLVGSIKEVVIKANMKYEADETLPFGEKKVIKVAEDGKKKVQDTGKYVNGKWVKGTDIETIIKPVQDGLTKVGNKEVSTNGDETITKIYEVNPDTGALTNPKVTKTVKMARLVPAQHHHNNQQTMSHTVDTSDHYSLSYYGMFLSALSVLCLILFKKEKLN